MKRASRVGLEDMPSVMGVPAPKGWPTEIKICGQSWRVEYSPNLSQARGALGVTDAAQRLIVLDATQAPESMVDVLWHELIHAILNSGPAWNLDPTLEESLVRQITPMLVSVLRAVKPWW